jgi:hypothetical protein
MRDTKPGAPRQPANAHTNVLCVGVFFLKIFTIKNIKQMEKINFLACEHLDFSDSYSATKDVISTNFGDKICWNRPTIDSSYPSLVQFCKQRGRLNNPQACLCSDNRLCSDYNDFSHTVEYTPDI